jgi:hypothetical protein
MGNCGLGGAVDVIKSLKNVRFIASEQMLEYLATISSLHSFLNVFYYPSMAL